MDGHCVPAEAFRRDANARAQLGSTSFQWAFAQEMTRAEGSFPGRWFGCGPLSARFAGCRNVASRARALAQKEEGQELSQEEARNLREKC